MFVFDDEYFSVQIFVSRKVSIIDSFDVLLDLQAGRYSSSISLSKGKRELN